ncbi:MAG: hypothetical protein PHP74_04230 [Candidatus Gracilibacteria bacterium]|nr:hypothetical protein [Candidatus Gracilibacteria bacterium]
MKRSNINIEQLRRNKYTSAEEKLDWLYSALEFGKAKKAVISLKKGGLD